MNVHPHTTYSNTTAHKYTSLTCLILSPLELLAIKTKHIKVKTTCIHVVANIKLRLELEHCLSTLTSATFSHSAPKSMDITPNPSKNITNINPQRRRSVPKEASIPEQSDKMITLNVKNASKRIALITPVILILIEEIWLGTGINILINSLLWCADENDWLFLLKAESVATTT